MKFFRAWAAAVVGMVCSLAAAAEIDMSVDAVGFGGRYRPGRLTPAFVTITNSLSTAVDGELRAVQLDDDGERLVWRVEVDLAAGATWSGSVLFCPQPDAVADGRVVITFGAMDGDDFRPAASVNLADVGPPPLKALVDGEIVVGVLGAAPGGIGVLNGTRNRVFTGEPVRVVHAPPKHVPPTWRGLDMIDVLVWDDPVCGELSPDQQRAIAQWVRRGGRLVIGLGARAKELAGSPLGRLLPVKIERVGERASDLAPLYKALGGLRRSAGGAMVRTTPRRDGRVLARDPATDAPLLIRGAVDAGGITVLAGTLREMGVVTRRWSDARALANLLGLQTLRAPRREQMLVMKVTDGLSGHLDSAGVGGMLIGLVVLLVLLYAALAGPGTWIYAKVKGRSHLSWWLFAAVVACASAAGVGLSFLSIGGESVSTALVLDLSNGSNYAVVRGYFGLYVPTHHAAKLEAAGDPFVSMTPMIDPSGRTAGEYPDRKTYSLRLDRPTELTVPIRRTIKRFALAWQGDVGGTLSGSVCLMPADSKEDAIRHVTGSVVNTLGVDLTDAKLIYPQPDRKDPFAVFTLGSVGRGETATFDSSKVGSTKTLNQWHVAMVGKPSFPHMPPMGAMGGAVGDSVTKRLDFPAKAALLSTLGLYDQPTGDNNRRPVGRDALTRLDRSCEIRAGWALLIASVDDYMPVGLTVDGDEPDASGVTVVRVLLPVREAPAHIK